MNIGCNSDNSPMILSQRASKRAGDAALIVQQVSLQLAQDKSQITLRRYFEHYQQDCGDWVEYTHSVSTRELVQWLMTHGQLRIEYPQTPTTMQDRQGVRP